MVAFVKDICSGKTVKINGVEYTVNSHNWHSFFRDPTRDDRSITVSGKNYPLIYNGDSLCDDLKYRKNATDKFTHSGPYSAFRKHQASIVPILDLGSHHSVA